MPRRDMPWWFWLATDVALAAALFLERSAVWVAIALAAIQIPLFARRGGGIGSFPAQVRIAYSALLLAGLWWPLGFVHWVQLVGTTAMVLFNYCFLARCLSLLPFNRTMPVSAGLLAQTFLSPPVAGSILSRTDTANGLP